MDENLNLDDLNELEDPTNSKLKVLDAIPEGFKECDFIYKSSLGDPKHNSLPIYLGLVKATNKYYFSIGPSNPFVLEKEELFYLVKSLGDLSKNLHKDKFGMDEISHNHQMETLVDKAGGVTLGCGDNTIAGEGLQELKELLSDKIESLKELLPDDLTDLPDTSESDNKEAPEDELEAAKENLPAAMKDLMERIDGHGQEEIKNEIEDVQKVMEDMTPEEKKELMKQHVKKHEEDLYNRAKDLEKELKGELVQEPEVLLTYEHFRNIFTNEGQQACKEELSKLPKEERSEMIHKILEEFNKKNEV